jgi:hypothetical protein
MACSSLPTQACARDGARGFDGFHVEAFFLACEMIGKV